MKKCKVININDGSPKMLSNRDRLCIEEYTRIEEILEGYFQQGYTLKQIVPTYSPNIQQRGNYSFYVNGYTVYLEKDE